MCSLPAPTRTSTNSTCDRENRNLDFISQFTNYVRHFDNASNAVADASLGFRLKVRPRFQGNRVQHRVTFQMFTLPDSNTQIHCDVSTGKPRSFVPQAHRRKIFDSFHGFSHPIIRSTTKLITDHFVWKKIRQDVRQWAKNCLSCQASKVHKHTRSPLACFPLPEARFRHIHVNFVCLLPLSNSFSYTLTCIDRFTCWPIAVPLRGTSSASVGKTLIE
nr:pol polyprotein [Hymenolepis microstoma]